MATVKEKLMQKIGEAGTRAPSKVTIVGVGQVGMACAYSIMQQVIKHQACSQGLYSPALGDGKNRQWKRSCQYTYFSFALYSFFSLPFPLLLFFLSFLPLFLVSCVLCLVFSLFPSLKRDLKKVMFYRKPRY